MLLYHMEGGPHEGATHVHALKALLPAGCCSASEHAHMPYGTLQPKPPHRPLSFCKCNMLECLVVCTGKSSLLAALLGEMYNEGGTVSVAGSTGYAAQDAWIQNATLRDNILMGSPLDEDR